MEFSDCFKHTGPCQISPDGKYVANCVDHRLVVREIETLKIEQLFQCLDAPQQVLWSGDSQLILCVMMKRAQIQVWSMEDPEWTCRMDEGAAGLSGIMWSPDDRHIITSSDFQLRLTVWSLVSQHTSYVQYPKFSCPQGCAFSRDGNYLAVLERDDCKDFVSVFACSSWQMIKHFPVDTWDACEISWSPDDSVICVQDSVLEYCVCVYTPAGHSITRYSAYTNALGVKTIKWAPSGQFLAVGSYDETVRLLNNLTWKKVEDFKHTASISDPSVVVYKETEVKQATANEFLNFKATGSVTPIQSQYEVQNTPCSFPVVRASSEKANPRLGVGIISFSPDSHYVATRNDNMPHCVWIWDVLKLRLIVVLHQMNPVRSLNWHPTKNTLAIGTGCQRIFLWSPGGCSAVEVPSGGSFSANGLSWSSDGIALLLKDKTRFCICYARLNSEDNGSEEEEEEQEAD